MHCYLQKETKQMIILHTLNKAKGLTVIFYILMFLPISATLVYTIQRSQDSWAQLGYIP